MSLHEFVEIFTGVDLPEEQNHLYNWRENNGRICFSISGLDWNYVHPHKDGVIGDILIEKEKHSEYVGRQIYRVADCAPYGVLFYRLCEADKDCDYETFIVGDFVNTDKSNHEQIITENIERVNIICKDTKVQ